MARALGLVFVFAMGGCTWGWDAFVVPSADGGARADAAPRDGGELDAGAAPNDAGRCDEDPLRQTCEAGEVCVRPATSEPACCDVGRCLLHEGRVRGAALRSAVTLGNPDGTTLEAEWEVTPRYPLTSVRTELSPPPQASDFAGSFRVLWDQNQMHLFIEGQDDVIETGMGLGTWEQVDAVEIFFDANPSVPAPDFAIDPDEAHFVVRIQPQTVEHLGPVEWAQTFVRGAADPATGAWHMEISIYWGESGFRAVSPGDVIGLEVVVHDVDAWDGPSDAWSWSPCTRLEPPKHIGLLELADRAATPMTCDQTCPTGLCAPSEHACSAASPLHCPP